MFVAVGSYTASIRKEVGARVAVLQLVKDVKAYEPIADAALTVRMIPRRYVSEAVITSSKQIQGEVAGADLRSGSFLQAGMLVPAPDLADGQREIAILVDAETGVAGKIRPGSVVDILATFRGNTRGVADRSDVIVANARVIEVGAQVAKRGSESTNFDVQRKVPITFALSPQESLAVTFAESFADTLRLALVGGGDRSPLTPAQRTFSGGLAGVAPTTPTKARK